MRNKWIWPCERINQIINKICSWNKWLRLDVLNWSSIKTMITQFCNWLHFVQGHWEAAVTRSLSTREKPKHMNSTLQPSYFEKDTHIFHESEKERTFPVSHTHLTKVIHCFFSFLFCHLLRCSLPLKCSPWLINTEAECWLTLSPTGPGGPTEPGSPRCPRFPSSPWGPITPWEPGGP